MLKKRGKDERRKKVAKQASDNCFRPKIIHEKRIIYLTALDKISFCHIYKLFQGFNVLFQRRAQRTGNGSDSIGILE